MLEKARPRPAALKGRSWRGPRSGGKSAWKGWSETMAKQKGWSILLLAALSLGLLAGCGNKETPPESTPPVAESVEPVATEPPVDPAYEAEEAVKTYWSEEQLTQEWGPTQVVEHLFFHPVIAYPEYAFSVTTESEAKGLDDWMVTVDEYVKILQSVYDKGYILVDMNDVWSEYTTEDGQLRMQRNTLMLPEGKKPLIISYDDVNYYDYMLKQGFTSKLVVGEDGNIWSVCKDPYTGEEFLTQDLDAITILDQFIREHPDFSLNGAKGCLCLTGYQGILGYRTNTESTDNSPEFEANRQKEIELVKPVIERLKETGWYFGSHSYGHINLAKPGRTLASVQKDTQRWLDEVGSLVGPTSLYFYPHGARPDGNDVTQTGPMFQYLQSVGFRVFASVGVESYSKIKTDISAVICDRLHPDGTTLRWSRGRYLQFYDAQDIIDLEVRPDYGYDFS